MVLGLAVGDCHASLWVTQGGHQSLYVILERGVAEVIESREIGLAFEIATLTLAMTGNASLRYGRTPKGIATGVKPSQ